MTIYKVLLEWKKTFTGGKVIKVEGEKWDEASAKLQERMKELEPEKFEKMVKTDKFKSWKQSIDYVTRYVVLNDLEEKQEE